jgi:hypothetical protein
VATKAAVKKVFLAIRHKNLEAVRALLDADPSLANSIASAPPKKDDGQSPLQVALKTGSYDVADLLLDRGADVNFIETSSVNEWRTPALHDMLRGLVAWIGDPTPGYAHHRTDAWRVFLRMIELGADTKATDSYGNTCLDRALLDANSKAAKPILFVGQLVCLLEPVSEAVAPSFRTCSSWVRSSVSCAADEWDRESIAAAG